ncbi:MAG: winged helix-turn-helix domain-containing protein [Candidatus Woesearchaeota archaeon]
MEKRGKLRIIKDILQIIQENQNSIKSTPLLRKSNLSSQRFSEYLTMLLEKKLVKEIEDKQGKKCFTLTDKGFKYLRRYEIIVGFIDEFGL